MLRQNNRYGAVHLLKNVPNYAEDTWRIENVVGVAANIADVEDLVLSENNDPQTHVSQRELLVKQAFLEQTENAL